MIWDDQHFELRLARSAAEVVAAQRLRYRVFIEELGGDGPMVDHANRREADAFDPFCDHLLLMDRRRDVAAPDFVLGVYRLLPGHRVGRGRGQTPHYYSEGEFDVTPLIATGRKVLELGRSCVHPEHRGGAVMHRLWAGLAEYVVAQDIDILFGVASFHGTDLDELSGPLSYLQHFHLAPAGLRPKAISAPDESMALIPADRIERVRVMQSMPPLIKAYLRLGGFVGEGVFVDRAFNTTDVCLVMDTAMLSGRQRNLYLRQTERAE